MKIYTEMQNVTTKPIEPAAYQLVFLCMRRSLIASVQVAALMEYITKLINGCASLRRKSAGESDSNAKLRL